MSEIPYGYCHCGCGQKTNLASETRANRGWIKGEPLRFLQPHSGMSPAERHARNVAAFHESYVVTASGCWEWTKARNDNGYAIIKRTEPNGRVNYAHRWSYETFVGPIPERFTIDHLCVNPPCVNPAHLEAVTNAENIRRAQQKTHCVRNHPFDAENTYMRKDGGGRQCKECVRIRRRAADRARREAS